MANINTFDRSLKVIARNHAELFLRLALPNAPLQLIGVPENVEISLPVQPVDFVHRALYRGVEHLLHLEFQLQHFRDFPRRMCMTHGALTQQYKLPVFSFALYLKYRKSPIPAEYVVKTDKQVIHRFTYPVIKLWEYAEQIRSGEYRELAPLLVMLVDRPTEQTLQTERQLILKEPNLDKRADLLSLALTLASQHFDRELLRRLFREEINHMRKKSLIDEWLEEAEVIAEARGTTKGMQAQLRKNILHILRIRFALAETEITRFALALEAVTNLEALEILFDQAATDFRIHEFEAHVMDIVPKNKDGTLAVV